MNVTSTTESAASTAAKATASEPAKTKITSDFDTFLTLLTTQLKYQDPTDPTDSAEFAVQLATFSGVEQQTETNRLLESLSSQLSASGLNDLAGWIGKEVRAEAPAYFHGDPIAIWPSPEPGADKAEVIVTNSAGVEVGRYVIAVSDDPVSWAGKNAAGEDLPDGLYSFSVQSFKEGKSLGTKPAEVFSLVTEARLEDGETLLVLLGDAKMKAAEVTALRNQS